MLTASALFSFSTQAQTTSPKLRFASPVLVSGTSGQVNATYKFSDVIPGVDACKVHKLTMVQNWLISTLFNAWQPTF